MEVQADVHGAAEHEDSEVELSSEESSDMNPAHHHLPPPLTKQARMMKVLPHLLSR